VGADNKGLDSLQWGQQLTDIPRTASLRYAFRELSHVEQLAAAGVEYEASPPAGISLSISPESPEYTKGSAKVTITQGGKDSSETWWPLTVPWQHLFDVQGGEAIGLDFSFAGLGHFDAEIQLPSCSVRKGEIRVESNLVEPTPPEPPIEPPPEWKALRRGVPALTVTAVGSFMTSGGMAFLTTGWYGVSNENYAQAVATASSSAFQIYTDAGNAARTKSFIFGTTGIAALGTGVLTTLMRGKKVKRAREARATYKDDMESYRVALEAHNLAVVQQKAAVARQSEVRIEGVIVWSDE
jgi:hypothetical protein